MNKQLRNILVLSVVWFGLAGVANAIMVTKKVVATTSFSASTSHSSSVVATGYCDKVRAGIFMKYSSSSTKLPALYAYTATSSTGPNYSVYTAKGSDLARGSFYLLDLTAANNAPYTKLVLTHAIGVTGTSEIWCTYDDGSR